MVLTDAIDQGRTQVAALVGLTRPRVVGLVVCTALPPLWKGGVPLAEAAWVLLAVGLLGAAASALNAYVDRDIDARMARTRHRPLPSGRLEPGAALGFGIALSILGLGLLASTHLLALALGLLTLVLYVGVYTLWLKRRSAWNMLVGSVPGAAAPLIADGADGALTAYGALLFAIVLLWQPPHFWAIGLFRSEDYRRAGVPLVHDRVGEEGTRWLTLGFSLALVAVGLGPWWIGGASAIYAAVTVILGAGLVGTAARAVHEQRRAADRRTFLASVTYLTFTYLALLV